MPDYPLSPPHFPRGLKELRAHRTRVVEGLHRSHFRQVHARDGLHRKQEVHRPICHRVCPVGDFPNGSQGTGGINLFAQGFSQGLLVRVTYLYVGPMSRNIGERWQVPRQNSDDEV